MFSESAARSGGTRARAERNRERVSGFRGIAGVVIAAVAFACVAMPARASADPGVPSANETSTASEPPDFNRDVYYRNKLEFAFDTGYLFYNSPTLLGPLIGVKFNREHGLPYYTLVPLMTSLRWQLYDVRGRSFWRGNTELTFGGTYTVITHGPEDYYGAIVIGTRYNFVQPNWRFVPYFEIHGGFGWTDAKQPQQVARHELPTGQGQDFTFTFMLGTGVRYNFNSRYSISAGPAYMHISNAYLSEPKYYNHGVNVIGPVFGLNIKL
jgi:lipid A 3-O-deacylase PagL